MKRKLTGLASMVAGIGLAGTLGISALTPPTTIDTRLIAQSLRDALPCERVDPEYLRTTGVTVREDSNGGLAVTITCYVD